MAPAENVSWFFQGHGTGVESTALCHRAHRYSIAGEETAYDGDAKTDNVVWSINDKTETA